MNDDELVFTLADEVEAAVLENENVINRLIERVLLKANIDSSIEIRRDWDGVSQADYMVRKMIGEYLANGKCKR